MSYLQRVNKILLALYFLSVFSYAQDNNKPKHNTPVMTHPTNINFEDNDSKHTDLTLLSQLHKIGEGKMKVLFWKVYKAEFYAKKISDQTNEYPQALKLTYQRNIDKKEFIDATEDQWNKLNQQHPTKKTSKVLEKKWLAELNNIFPDINENDVILFTLNEHKQANFYLKAFDKAQKNRLGDYQLIGSINDPLFGDHFLSIWLSKYTSEPALRKKLLNL